MKNAFVLLLIGCMACAQTKTNMDKEIKLENENLRASYGIGALMAKNVKSQGADSLDLDALFKGFYD